MNSNTITVRGPINIAVIKYWGKRDEELILPLNDSLSLTLDTDTFYARTTVAFNTDFKKDRLWVNGKEEDVSKKRLQNCLAELRKRASDKFKNGCLHICSENNFPTAAGLASSAAGFSALVCAVAKVFHIEDDVSDIARLGSGSACRSLFGGFVQWHMGKALDGHDCIARQVYPAKHWPELMILILIVNEDKKDNSSTSGMNSSVKTSDLLSYRTNHCVPERVKAIKKAITEKDFQTFGTITMKESNQLHAICMDTFPPCLYLNHISHTIIKFVHAYNSLHQNLKVAYTFDAGSNAFLFVEQENYLELCAVLQYVFPNDQQDFFLPETITDLPNVPLVTKEKLTSFSTPLALRHVVTCRLGLGVTEDHSGHLLGQTGLPTSG